MSVLIGKIPLPPSVGTTPVLAWDGTHYAPTNSPSLAGLSISGLGTAQNIVYSGAAGLLTTAPGLAVAGTMSASAPSGATNGPTTITNGPVAQALDGGQCQFVPVSYGNGSAAASGMTGYVAQGTAASPSAATTTDVVFFGLRGHDGTAYTSSRASMTFGIPSLWTNSNHETQIQFGTTANASTTKTTVLTLKTTGATFTTPLLPGGGSIGAPSFAFSNDLTTGAYRAASNTFGIVCNGVDRFRFGGNQFTQNFNAVATGTSPITSFASVSIHGLDATQTSIGISAYGALPVLLSRRAEGTAAALTKTVNGTSLFACEIMGYQETTPAYSAAKLTNFVVASEDWTSTAQGFRQSLYSSANGSTTQSERLRVDQSGSILIGTTTDGMTAGGSLAIAQDFRARQTTDSSSVSTGSAVISGGMGVAKRSFLGTIGSTFSGNVIAGVQDATGDTAGAVGEELTAIQSTATNYTATATYQDITSLSLTPGKWRISAFATLLSNGATLTATANAIFAISTATASATGVTEGKGDIAYISEALNAVSGKESIDLFKVVNISATTTYYFSSQATFTVGNPQFVGGMSAIRIR